jgi:hypothetical protein
MVLVKGTLPDKLVSVFVSLRPPSEGILTLRLPFMSHVGLQRSAQSWLKLTAAFEPAAAIGQLDSAPGDSLVQEL